MDPWKYFRERLMMKKPNEKHLMTITKLLIRYATPTRNTITLNAFLNNFRPESVDNEKASLPNVSATQYS